ncbi:hypothetical protein [Tenacibaculum sp.]|uniref:hypothetical protein n=1 Tax=Tenacibaculum sp. TaxID=1906242 RepID=UPI003AA8B11E
MSDYWQFIAIFSIFLVSLTLNRTVFADKDVRSAKYEIDEAGIGATEDKLVNEELERKRSVSIKVSLLLSFLVLLTSKLT